MSKFIVKISKACHRHDIMNLSANISFFAILSLLPLSMIFMSVLGFVVGNETIVTQVAEVVTDVIPGSKEIFLANIQNLIEKKSALGFWGIGFLLIISTILFGSLERAFNAIFETETSRGFLKSRLLAILVICIIILLLFLPFAVRTLESFLDGFGYSIPLYSYISGKVFFVAFTVLAFTTTLIIVPNQKVHFRNAAIGGVIFAGGVALAKFIFHWYLSMTFSRYNVVYGSLTAIILMVIWIYYLATILLISTEIVAYLQQRKGARWR